MQANRIALCVANDRNESIGSNAELWPKHPSTIFDRQVRLDGAIFAMKINHRSLL